jgi:hypothetical protein
MAQFVHALCEPSQSQIAISLTVLAFFDWYWPIFKSVLAQFNLLVGSIPPADHRGRNEMSKLVWIATLLSFLAVSVPAIAANNKCQQRCSQNCSGKGNVCLNRCLERCATVKTR